jgi:propanediol dehydratase large subunit
MTSNSTPSTLSSKSSESLTNLKTQRDIKFLQDAIQQCHNRKAYDRSLTNEGLNTVAQDMVEYEAQLLTLSADV